MKKIGVIIGLLLIPVLVSAKSSYLTQFNTKYGTSGTRLNMCSLCHPGGNTGQLNNYANTWDAAGGSSTAFATIEPQDADGDGFSNLIEINARTFPGLATDFPIIKIPKAPTNITVNRP
jgi:hypothetical protein